MVMLQGPLLQHHSMAIVKPEDLTRYAASESAPFKIGELIRRLVYTWVKPEAIDVISFHAGTANNLPGWDGALRLKAEPSGAVFSCLWELSVQDADAAKIRRDFAKRMRENLPEGWRHDRTTLALVTCRKLQDRFALQNELRRARDNPWADVQIIDAPALSQWISMCPPVEAWCAEELGIGGRRFGLSLDGFWKHWSQDTDPNISAALMLAGRQAKLVPEDLAPGAQNPLNVLADSPEEAAAYVHALLGTEAFQRTCDALLGRSLVIKTEADARAYAEEPPLPGSTPLTILLPPATGAAQFVASKGHIVVSALGQSARDVASVRRLGRGLAQDLAQALSFSMRVLLADTAMRQARDCGSSVTIWNLQNRMSRSGGLGEKRPLWAEPALTTTTLPAVLAQGWDEAFVNDKAVLSALAGQTYGEFESALHRFINCDGPLLQKTHGVVTVVAPAVSFFLTSQALTEQRLRVFRESFERVVQWVSPSKTDDFEGRSSFRVSDHESGYSEWLRDGMSASLLLMSAFQARLEGTWPAAAFGSPQDFVDSAVKQTVLLTMEPVYFYALGRSLLVLAEASPLAFLDAVEETLNTADAGTERLFVSHGFLTPDLFQPLLHSLELVAQEPNCLERATRLLLQLARCDRSAERSRPLERLSYIYQAAGPSSGVTIDQKVEVLRHLSAALGSEVWQLALRLITNRGGHNGAPVPRWKDFGRSSRPPQDREGVAADFAKYADLCLELAGTDVERLREVLKLYAKLPDANRIRLSQALASTLSTRPDDEKQREVWNDAGQILHRHRQHANQPWALPETSLFPLVDLNESILPRLSPEEVMAWLFKLDRDSYTEQVGEMLGQPMTREELRQRQHEAVAEIRTRSGIPGLARLVALTGNQFSTCNALSAGLSEEDALAVCDVWAGAASDSWEHCVAIACMSAMRLSMYGAGWTDAVLQVAEARGWQPVARAMIFLNYLDSFQLFEKVSSLGKEAEDIFWSKRHVNLEGSSGKLVTFMALRMIQAGRAIDLLSRSNFRTVRTRALLHIVRTATVEFHSSRGARDLTMLDYYFGCALDELKKRPAAKKHLAELEYPLFELLHANHPERVFELHRELASKPQTFMLFMRRLYFPKGTPRPEVLDTQTQVNGRIAYSILSSWRMPPGVSFDGVSVPVLRDWLAAVRASAASEGLVEATENEIGRMLRHMPPNRGDKRWPSDELAEVLEELDSERIVRGIVHEVHNAADVTTRDVLETGDPERLIATGWLAAKQRLPLRYRRARQLCDWLAESFSSFAKLSDKHTDLLRVEWSR